MTTIICLWVIIGMSFSLYNINLLCKSVPRLMDVIVQETISEAREAGIAENRLEPKSIEFWICVSMTVVWVLAWPLLAVKRML